MAALALLGAAVMLGDHGDGSRIVVAAADDATSTTTAPEPFPDVDLDKAEPSGAATSGGRRSRATSRCACR